MDDTKDRTPSEEEVPGAETDEDISVQDLGTEEESEPEVAEDEEPSIVEPLPVTEDLETEGAVEAEAPVAEAEEQASPPEEVAAEPADSATTRPASDNSITRLVLLVAGLMILIFGGIFYFMTLPPESQLTKAESQGNVKSQPAAAVPSGQKIKIPITPPQEQVAQQTVQQQPVAAVEEVKPVAPKAQTSEPAVSEKQPAAQATAPSSVKEEPVAAAPAEAPAATEPTQPTASTEPAAPSTTEQAESEPVAGDYSLLAGSFLKKAYLEETEAKIAKLGLTSKVRSQLIPVTMTRVKVGTFPLEEGRQRLDTLRAAIPEAFATADGQNLTLYAGSFVVPKDADAMLSLLREQGIEGELERVDMKMDGFSLSIGPFATRQEAEEALQKTRQAGLDTLLFRHR